ncbi:MAG: hypothetical protein BA870_10670 [Desulfuromonadales bacterium C00003094]|nr:MAG: hypothetical protein BA870_10670 [Desulfuromonadales bacterium C00003094]
MGGELSGKTRPVPPLRSDVQCTLPQTNKLDQHNVQGKSFLVKTLGVLKVVLLKIGNGYNDLREGIAGISINQVINHSSIGIGGGF